MPMLQARHVALVVLGALAVTAHAQPPRRTYANPVDIDYRYNFEQLNERISYRTGADPVVVRHGDAYYLFQTLADGYWRSTDLLDWRFVAPSRWPSEGIVAPAVASDGERLIIMQSAFQPRALLQSRDPDSGRIDFLTRLLPRLPDSMAPGQDRDPPPGKVPPGPWDPALFRDDDGRWYLYWGSSYEFPMYGMEVAIGRDSFEYIGMAKTMLSLHPRVHGWERFGHDHRAEGSFTYMEGAWMTKVRGRYYLQYGAPGTEYNVYANGTYVGEHPLGPFEYAPYNPVAYKPGGFVTGAGHGSTFQDEHGNWWNTGTPWIGANWTFERRIAMFPAAFHDDGQMWASARFGDFPHWMPDRPVSDPESLFTGWMLLSYRKPATASSTLEDFAAARATDENPRTYWVSARSVAGDTLAVDLGAEKTVRAVQVNFADHKAGRYGDAPDIYTAFRLEHSRDGEHWQPLAEVGDGAERRDRPNAYLPLPAPVRTRHVRYVHGHVGAAHLAISDLRVFGNADGEAPRAPDGVAVERARDRRNATVRWNAVPGAVGYNVRWGLREDRLHLSYQVFADRGTVLEVRALNVGPSYRFAVEAFDDNGVSPLSGIVAAD